MLAAIAAISHARKCADAKNSRAQKRQSNTAAEPNPDVREDHFDASGTDTRVRTGIDEQSALV
jgi:hypothetical protein